MMASGGTPAAMHDAAGAPQERQVRVHGRALGGRRRRHQGCRQPRAAGRARCRCPCAAGRCRLRGRRGREPLESLGSRRGGGRGRGRGARQFGGRSAAQRARRLWAKVRGARIAQHKERLDQRQHLLVIIA